MIEGISKVDMDDYKDKLIQQQGWVCPVTQRYVECQDVEIIFVNDMDYAISKMGMEKLKEKYGVEYINNKVVEFKKLTTEDEVVRDYTE